MKFCKLFLIILTSLTFHLGRVDPAHASTVHMLTFTKGDDVPRTDPNGKPLTTVAAQWNTLIRITETDKLIKDIRLEYELIDQTWNATNQGHVKFLETPIPPVPPQVQPVNTWKVVGSSVTAKGARAKWELEKDANDQYPGAIGAGGSVVLQAIFPKSSKLKVRVIEFSYVDGTSLNLAGQFTTTVVPLPGSIALLMTGLLSVGALTRHRKTRPDQCGGAVPA